MGPDTWEPVAQELRARDAAVVVPALVDDGAQPFWRQHVACVVDAVERQAPAGADLVVAVHSGAGQLAGHLASDLSAHGHGIAALVFVDAGLPPQGRSRLDQVRDEASEFAEELDGSWLLVARSRTGTTSNYDRWCQTLNNASV